jgi:hypothetical protein
LFIQVTGFNRNLRKRMTANGAVFRRRKASAKKKGLRKTIKGVFSEPLSISPDINIESTVN